MKEMQLHGIGTRIVALRTKMPQTAQMFTERLSERTIPVRDRLKMKGGWLVPPSPWTRNIRNMPVNTRRN